MQYKQRTPKEVLNSAYRKQKPYRTDIERFKSALITLLGKINVEESEEHAKTLVRDFLLGTHYGNLHEINVKGRTDLVIHSGNSSQTPVSVILEAKRPSNKTEFPTISNLNVKSFHELILYYFRERIDNGNIQVRHLVITNGFEWFVFDGEDFYAQFYQNSTLRRQYSEWKAGQTDSTRTEMFYKDIAKPFVESSQAIMPFTYFNVKDFEEALRNASIKDDHLLIPVFKFLSPHHLLKVPFANDSNSLNKQFYLELLHIIGLEEVKDGGKKLIQRKKAPDPGSLLENTISILRSEDRLSRLKSTSQFGDTHEEQLFQIGLELCLTWLNRILFLKLLEAQLLNYHNRDKQYAFLNKETIKEYDDLNELFFRVLAEKQKDRGADVVRFLLIPYLNSSLFELSELEHDTIVFSNLKDRHELPFYKKTVFDTSKPLYKKGGLNALEYLLDFLDSYDFSSEGSEEIQEEQKSLISASVLGLIYEKINGYKDGSFFTPGYITEYMCRESIRAAVVEKFNAHYKWNCQQFEDLYNKIEDAKKANEIINTLTICDPAVGSGHFLVSALNEIITIKSELRILSDTKGQRLKEYTCLVENDELVITDEHQNLFKYIPKHPESQRIQEALFQEKKLIIEQCLFGVDINPNSVRICRLRLWIELLKHSFYTRESGYAELETLPNLDINIKQGDSVISRYDLDSSVSDLLKKSKWNISSYKLAVQSYRSARDKTVKREMNTLINTIKKDFESEVHLRDKRRKKLNEMKGVIFNMSQQLLFGISEKEQKKRAAEIEKTTKQIESLENQLAEIEQNKVFEGAFEWRFEFPEVLDIDGAFIGFDVVIGNPPYIRQEEILRLKPFLEANYAVYHGTADLLVYFIERGISLLKDGGVFTFIISNKFMRANFGKPLRQWLLQYRMLEMIDFGDLPVFQEATTYPMVIRLQKAKPVDTFSAANVPELRPLEFNEYLKSISFITEHKRYSADSWTLSGGAEQKLMDKLMSTGRPLGELVNGKIFRGVLTGLNEAFVIDEASKNRLIAEDPGCAEILKPFLAGRDVKRYQVPVANKYLIFTRRGIEIEKYPSVLKHLSVYRSQLEPRPEGVDQKKWPGRKPGSYKWYEIQDSIDYYKEFEKPKIIYPNILKRPEFTYDASRLYTNQKCFIISDPPLELLGILNSKAYAFLFEMVLPKLRGDFFEPSYIYMKTLPVPELAPAQNIRINDLVNTAMTSLARDMIEEIDSIVFEAFHLKDSEIEAIDQSIKKQFKLVD